jgi:large subunit ribosomal protein LX
MGMKTFEFAGTFKMGKVTQRSFTKTLAAKSQDDAMELLYSILGSKHRCPRRCIVIKEVKEVKNE